MRQQAATADKALYWSDFPAGVVGCALQYQFCYPRAGKEDFRTELGPSPSPNTPPSDWPDATPVQASVLQFLQSVIRVTDMNRSPQLGNLRASKAVLVGISPGLPDHQWVQEVIGWEAFVWTGYQTLLSASVIRPKVFDESGDEYRDVPTSAGDKQFCQPLKMRKAGGFANINVFALVFLTTFSAIITLFNTMVLRFLIFLSKFRQALAPRIDRWVQDGIFQLQRRAFEAQDEGKWVDLESEIPITEQGERLSELSTASVTTCVPDEKGKPNKFNPDFIGDKEGDLTLDKVPNFRISVGRVDTGDTLVEMDLGDDTKCKKQDR